MALLITGSSGSLGQLLANALREHHYEILECDLALGHDICDYEALLSCFAKHSISGIVHLAAVANLNFFKDAPQKSRAINLDGTRNVLRLAQECGAWVMFASTCCAYGNNGCHPSDETSPLAPTESYAESKVLMEPEVLAADQRNVVMRLATFYGPTMRPEMAPAIFIDRIHRGETISVHGSGNQTRTTTFEDDIVGGIVTLVDNVATLPHRIYNITTEKSLSVLDMIRSIQKIVGKPAHLVFENDREGQILEETISSRRLQDLGWRARVDFQAGITQCYRRYLDNGACWTQHAGAKPASNL